MTRSTVVTNFPRPRTACRDTNLSAHAPGSNDSQRERRRIYRPCAERSTSATYPPSPSPKQREANGTSQRHRGGHDQHRQAQDQPPPSHRNQPHHSPSSTTPANIARPRAHAKRPQSPPSPPPRRGESTPRPKSRKKRPEPSRRPGFVQDGGLRQESPGPRQRVIEGRYGENKGWPWGQTKGERELREDGFFRRLEDPSPSYLACQTTSQFKGWPAYMPEPQQTVQRVASPACTHRAFVKGCVCVGTKLHGARTHGSYDRSLAVVQ